MGILITFDKEVFALVGWLVGCFFGLCVCQQDNTKTTQQLVERRDRGLTNFDMDPDKQDFFFSTLFLNFFLTFLLIRE